MLNSNEIQALIPHRYPFLLVDRMESVEPAKHGVGIKSISSNEPFFQGHFPGMHIMPGVLIVEAMAQVGAVVILCDEQFRNKKALFAGIKEAKFRRKVIPGDQLRMIVEITRMKKTFGIGLGKAYVNDELACEAEFSFVIYDETKNQ